ncbi:DUF3800 domain-containing protein [Homoserinibacter sp. GY 40078]|uniref:DUF3800 domain-containing protein n=1 Tax=Homoserinibacter sp. GY 40078 TaxID=2603275 RepID=UPI0011CBA1C3|nr:DUF3800 domain-containing protein [Homoserinibacter sp. GY 40078]TXK18645.1 hypothetical protein FVQ89_01470 [Homoserinibacter sp. GY 40078]
MSTLSIFVDESGDFGDSADGYYVLAFVVHEQHHPLDPHLQTLDRQLREIGLEGHAVHSGAAIRGEAEYRYMAWEQRKGAFTRMHAFVRRAPILYYSLTLKRRDHPQRFSLEGAIARGIGTFLQDRTEYFRAFDEVVVYYDNGQAEITRILNTVMNAYFLQVEFRRMQPADYRLFQAADLACTLELLRAKDEDGVLTRSDLFFFESARKLRKDYVKPFDSKRLA